MRIDGKFSEHKGVPMRTVVEYSVVRRYLDDQLTATESGLRVDISKVKVMPYVLVVGEGAEQGSGRWIDPENLPVRLQRKPPVPI